MEQKTFLPGLHLHHGVLQIDLDKLAFAGDILHEAGHIAVCEPQERQFHMATSIKMGYLMGANRNVCMAKRWPQQNGRSRP